LIEDILVILGLIIRSLERKESQEFAGHSFQEKDSEKEMTSSEAAD